MKIKSAHNGIVEVFEQIYNNSNISSHELDEGQWVRNLVRFLVKDEQKGKLPNNSFNKGLEDRTLWVTNDSHNKKECHTKLKIKENFLKRAIEQMIRFISVNEFDQPQIGNTADYKRPLNGSLKSDESSTREDYSGINDLGEDRAGFDPRSEPDCISRKRLNLIKAQEDLTFRSDQGEVQTTDKRFSKELDKLFTRVNGPGTDKKKS
ncbi:hypothetical protein PPACK8108_LOCUS26110 [Phakopsora pachyrhizi]|uniref:Uncharacterized protein n=1 Tax=Phakopsora pachyrhizi TaxID=170000 RepID=A0AAV0BWJ9_PHAPC|nr:hypothetical protein PPACK8108_LOCUS26110 [Phakopsora pachyrhizi]